MTDKALGYAAVIGIVLLQVYCQMVFKWRINPSNGMDVSSTPLQLILRFVFDPWVLSAIAASFAGMLAWIVALSRLEVSVAYPIASAVIPLVAAGGIVFFAESLTLIKGVGIALVFIGVLCVGLG